MAKIGQIIDSRWEITEKLSSNSGQARTYIVQDLKKPNNNTKYVIKLLKSINDKTLARFEKEIKATFNLVHPNIVHAEDAKYENTSMPYLVTQFCSGEALTEEKIKTFTLIEKLKMFKAICEAIAYAHAHEPKVIHRDIKPLNIFLLDKESKTPVVGDFGICFFEEDESDGERLTAIKEPVGAKSFRPPEAEFGVVENINPSFDVYSLGKFLYWFLSNGEFLSREYYSIPRYDLRNESSEHAIHEAYNIFEKSIREDPKERYINASAMLEDVKKLMSSVEINARYLDCNIPQNCIFCRNGKYEFLTSPNISGGKLDYLASLSYGIDFRQYNGKSWHEEPLRAAYSPRVMIAQCNICGNVQQFQFNKFGSNEDFAKNWKNVPEAK